jgi:hypothetical protein
MGYQKYPFIDHLRCCLHKVLPLKSFSPHGVGRVIREDLGGGREVKRAEGFFFRDAPASNRQVRLYGKKTETEDVAPEELTGDQGVDLSLLGPFTARIFLLQDIEVRL